MLWSRFRGAQGERDGCADELEGAALVWGGSSEGGDDGLVVAEVVAGQGAQVVDGVAEAANGLAAGAGLAGGLALADADRRAGATGVAKAAGAEPEPLIREFDATRQMPQALTLADIFPDTPTTPVTPTMPGTAAATRERQRPNKTQALAAAGLAAFLVALAFAAYGLLSGSRHAATAAPRARGQPTAQHEPGPNRRERSAR